MGFCPKERKAPVLKEICRKMSERCWTIGSVIVALLVVPKVSVTERVVGKIMEYPFYGMLHIYFKEILSYVHRFLCDSEKKRVEKAYNYLT